jgi:hypothetical protein
MVILNSNDNQPKILSPGWNPDRYLNIWVTNLNRGLLGYSWFPAWPRRANILINNVPNNNVVVDGIVMNFRAFGVNTQNTLLDYELGRILTHEVGHWLGLYHIWGKGQSASSNQCGDDLIDDTPSQAGATEDCPSGAHRNHDKYCYEPHIEAFLFGDMFMNHMDYSYDRCRNMFSNGQCAAMRQVLRMENNRGGRLGLRTSPLNACLLPLQAYIDASESESAPGTTVSLNVVITFTNANPLSYRWEYRELNAGTNSWSRWFPSQCSNTPNCSFLMPGGVSSVQMRVFITDANGVTISEFVTVRSTQATPVLRARVSLPTTLLALSLAPNPASDQVTVNYQLPANSSVSIAIFNSINQVVAQPFTGIQEETGQRVTQINIATLQSGIYRVLLRAITSSNQVLEETVPLQIIR